MDMRTSETQRETALIEFLQASHRLIRMAARATGDTTPSLVRQILALLDHEGSLRVGEIAALLRVRQPAVTQTLAPMTQAGLVTRHADPTDARATIIALAPAGLRTAVAWRHTLAETLSPLFAGLTDEDWDHFVAASRVITDIVGTTSDLDAPARP